MKNIYELFFILAISFSQFAHAEQPIEAQKKSPGINIAVVNFYIKGETTLADHLKHIEDLAIAGKAKGAKYLLLPELLDFDMLPANPPEIETKKYMDQLATNSKEYELGLKNICIKQNINLIGATMVVKKGQHYINRALYISETGVVNYQDKIQPTPWEARNGFKGGVPKITLFKDSNFSFVILTCYDAEFPTISNSLIKNKPEVIFVPSQTGSNFGLNRVKLTSAARAVEHMAFVLMTGASGNPDAPWHSYFGQNFLFTPQNDYFSKDLQTGVYNQETVSVFELDLEKLRQSRHDLKQIYPSRDARKL